MRRIALLVCLVTGAAAAQPSTVDGELAFALLNIRDADALVADDVPESIQAFLPEGATLVGSVRRPEATINGESVDGATAIAWVKETPEEAARAYSGRTYPDLSLRRYLDDDESKGGFVTTRETPTSFSYYPASQDGRVVHVTFRERPWGGAYVLVQRRPLYRFEQISGAEASSRADLTSPPLSGVLPRLTPPRETMQRRTGGGGSDDDLTSRATLVSDAALDVIAEHYGEQLASAGWVFGARSQTDSAVLSTWTRQLDGEALAAMFYAHRSEPDHAELAIMVLGPDR